MADWTNPMTWTAGLVVTADHLNEQVRDNLDHLYDAINDVVIVSDTKSSGTDGGTFTQGAWRTHDLNTEDADPAGIASVASNQVTLQAGTYLVEAFAVGHECGNHQLRLRDITNSANLAIGITSAAGDTDDPDVSSLAALVGRFTISTATVIELQHRCGATKADIGFGENANWGSEIYALVKFTRIAAG